MAEIEQTPEAPRDGGMKGKLVAGGIISAIVVVESILAFMLVPDPDKIAAQVKGQISASESADDEDSLVPMIDDGPVNEVELGTFNVAIHEASANTTFNVVCKVIATVAPENASEFEDLLANNQARLSERIMIQFRSATPADLTEPGLGLIKRRILEKSNALLGKPLIRAIVFPEYNYHVQ